MILTIAIDVEDSGRIVADVPELPGCMIYGETEETAVARVKQLALLILAEQIGLNGKDIDAITFLPPKRVMK